MVSNTPESMMPVAPVERRPAIWPWFVMPLIALTAYYYLDRFKREANERADLAPAPRAALINSEARDRSADVGDAGALSDAGGNEAAQRPTR